MTEQSNCRYCGKEIAFEKSADTFQIIKQCPQCGYFNVFEAFTWITDLSRLKQRWNIDCEFPADTAGSPELERALLRLVSAMCGRALEIVRDQLPVAGAAVISLMARREKLIQQEIASLREVRANLDQKIIRKAVPLLYALVTLSGGPQAIGNNMEKTRDVAKFLSWFEEFSSEVILIADSALKLRRGELVGSIQGQQLKLFKTPRHSLDLEWIIAKKEREARKAGEPAGFSPQLLQAEEEVLGFSGMDMFQLFKDGFGSASEGAVRTVRDVRIYELTELTKKQRALFAHCTLGLDRMRAFRYPFFFDTGDAWTRKVDDARLLMNSLTFNWSAYYPFLDISSAPDRLERVATTRGVIVQFLANLESQRGCTMEQLAQQAKDRGLDAAHKSVKALIREASEELESHAAATARARGWKTAKGPHELPCGEIDGVYMFRTTEGKVVVVVAEAKAADFTIHRKNTFEMQDRLVEKACDQLCHKAEWVARHWATDACRRLFNEAGNNEHTGFVKLLVTRDVPPLDVVERAEAVSANDLGSFLARFERGIPQWFLESRPKAVVSPESARNVQGHFVRK